MWQIAASPMGTMLAVACDDGCLRVFSLADGGFNLQRVFAKREGNNNELCNN